jgi:hypothetical protein
MATPGVRPCHISSPGTRAPAAAAATRCARTTPEAAGSRQGLIAPRRRESVARGTSRRSAPWWALRWGASCTTSTRSSTPTGGGACSMRRTRTRSTSGAGTSRTRAGGTAPVAGGSMATGSGHTTSGVTAQGPIHLGIPMQIPTGAAALGAITVCRGVQSTRRTRGTARVTTLWR